MSPPGGGVVLLDGLGTLIRLAAPAPALAAVLRRRHGIEIAPQEAAGAFAAEMAYYREHHHEAYDESTLAALRRRCAEVLGAGLPRAVSEALSADEMMEAMLGSLVFSAYPDALPALAALRAQGLLLVVVSNWDAGLPLVLHQVGLRPHLDGAVSSGEVGHPKPDPRIFAAALAMVGASPQQALHVGDSVANDVEGALAAGIAAVLLERGRRAGTGEREQHGGVPSIGSLEELPAILAERSAGGSTEPGAIGMSGR